eukprot:269097-Chlamydomonas_euryale.AAC.4
MDRFGGKVRGELDARVASFGLDPSHGSLTDEEYAAMMLELSEQRQNALPSGALLCSWELCFAHGSVALLTGVLLCLWERCFADGNVALLTGVLFCRSERCYAYKRGLQARKLACVGIEGCGVCGLLPLGCVDLGCLEALGRRSRSRVHATGGPLVWGSRDSEGMCVHVVVWVTCAVCEQGVQLDATFIVKSSREGGREGGITRCRASLCKA